MILSIYIITSLIIYIITSGWMFAYQQITYECLAKKQRNSDRAFSIFFTLFMSMFNVIGLLIGYSLTDRAKHGWMSPFAFVSLSNSKTWFSWISKYFLDLFCDCGKVYKQIRNKSKTK